uniref:ZC3H15/TMA46 family C-terminal domain-containing protein n=1 Tax=Salix viminalis TaxID=40686 RepID=A0A6N2LTY3_SALVM
MSLDRKKKKKRRLMTAVSLERKREQGLILQARKEKKMDAEKDKQTNEMPKSNPLTQAQFLLWKRQKDADSSARKAEATRKREEDIAAGTVQMNGRELFLHEPWVFDNSQY